MIRILLLLVVAALGSQSMSDCRNADENVRSWIAAATCHGEWDARDRLECNNSARGTWLRDYDFVTLEGDESPCVFLFQRRGRIGWAATRDDGQVFLFLVVEDHDAWLTVEASYSLADVLLKGTRIIATQAEAKLWIKEILHAAMAPRVLMSGLPLGRPFFDEHGELPCDSEYHRVRGYCEVKGSPIEAVWASDRWIVRVAEWCGVDCSAFEWRFDLRRDGTLADLPVIRQGGDAAGRDVAFPLGSADAKDSSRSGEIPGRTSRRVSDVN